MSPGDRMDARALHQALPGIEQCSRMAGEPSSGRGLFHSDCDAPVYSRRMGGSNRGSARDERKEMILVIHPDVAFHDALRSRLPDHEVVGARSAESGLNTCCAIEPACMLVANRLPDYDARWLIEAVRAETTAV